MPRIEAELFVNPNPTGIGVRILRSRRDPSNRKRGADALVPFNGGVLDRHPGEVGAKLNA